MKVVADTSVITNLYAVNGLFLLRGLFKEVIIPMAVYDELAVIQSQKKLLDQ